MSTRTIRVVPLTTLTRAVALGSGLVAACVVTACSGVDALSAKARKAADERSAQARDVARQSGLGTDVQELLGRAAGAIGARFTVTYTSPDGTVVVTQDPPRLRVEVTQVDGRAEANITNFDGTFRCTRPTGQGWTCRPTQPDPDRLGGFAASAVQRTVSGLAAAKGSYGFRVERRTIAGVAASCLVTERLPAAPPDPSAGQRGVLCVSAEGVPLAIETDQTTLAATAFSTKVRKDPFTLPAPAEARP